MFNYRNEASFSNALCKAMRNKGWFIQRIESGTTGKGIPDIYSISPQCTAIWFELKRVHHNCGPVEQIPWRPGQQAWLRDVVNRSQSALTLVAFNDCILVISHLKVFHDNTVQVAGVDAPLCTKYKNFKELLG